LSEPEYAQKQLNQPSRAVGIPKLVQPNVAARLQLRHEFAFDFAFESMPRVRRIAHSGVDLSAVVEDAARICERFKTPSTVVLPHTRVAHASKRKSWNQRMDRTIVDFGIARFGRVENPLGHAKVFGEHV
jgi:hypothetical protein